MARPKARLYQRLRTKGFPWVLCDVAKNGGPKARPDAFQFGVRYSLNGKRKLDAAATLDEAVATLKVANVRLCAAQNGVEMAGTTRAGFYGGHASDHDCRGRRAVFR